MTPSQRTLKMRGRLAQGYGAIPIVLVSGSFNDHRIRIRHRQLWVKSPALICADDSPVQLEPGAGRSVGIGD